MYYEDLQLLIIINCIGIDPRTNMTMNIKSITSSIPLDTANVYFDSPSSLVFASTSTSGIRISNQYVIHLFCKIS